MFKWLNKQGVESDRGFIVQFTGRFSLEYRKNGKVVSIKWESGGKDHAGRVRVCVEVTSIEYWSGGLFSKKKVTDVERSEILSDLNEALDFMNLSLVKN